MDGTQIIDYENLSDEEFLALQDPHKSGSGVPAQAEESQDEQAGEDADLDTAADAPAPASAEVPAEPSHHTEPQQTEEVDEPTGDAAAAAQGVETPAAEGVNYEEAYRKIMAPFKANGREFKPESPEEVIRLAQQGANYTQKMQALAPHLKIVKMLENQGLLNEEKLSHLIDLSRKDKGAIQKLLADSQLDPLDLDVSKAADYRPNSYAVSDREMMFQTALTDVLSAPGGQDTLREINASWDQASKDKIYEEPRILGIIQAQRENGIYDRITSELARQRILGNLTDVPFLQAYKMVGDTLNAAGKLTLDQNSAAQPNTPAPVLHPQPLETRAVPPKSTVSNGQAARAASPVRAASKPVSREVDYSALSDADFLKAAPPPRG